MLSLRQQTNYLLKKYKIVPNKELGQNFLISGEVLGKIIQAASLERGKVILEVGAGLGTLTVELAKRTKKVIAVEIDRSLYRALISQVLLYKNVEVFRADIFRAWRQISQKLKKENYQIVANLPYYLTSYFLRWFLENSNKPEKMVLLLQKEVAQRISAVPGKMSLLSVSVQFYGQPELIASVPADSFWPAPEVDSAILRVSEIEATSQKHKKLLKAKINVFFKILKVGFSARRKQLHNNLASGFHLSSNEVKEVVGNIGLNPLCRPQDLSIKQWIYLANALNILLENKKGNI